MLTRLQARVDEDRQPKSDLTVGQAIEQWLVPVLATNCASHRARKTGWRSGATSSSTLAVRSRLGACARSRPRWGYTSLSSRQPAGSGW
jgi:hypothetical protein